MDLNSDLGEGFGHWTLGDDDALLDVVTSANVACGFHAGDPTTMRRTCAAAVARGVAIGAQVGYRDLAGFGRRFIDVEPAELTDDVLYQLGSLEAMARVAGSRVRYVKPHGALYSAIVSHEDQAAAVVEAVLLFNRSLPVLGLPGSAWLRLAASAGLATVSEAFADRAYTAAGSLVPRGQPGAVLHEAGDIAARCVRLAVRGEVLAVDGSLVPVRAQSICVHGDTPGAVAIAGAVRDALLFAQVGLAAFALIPDENPGVRRHRPARRGRRSRRRARPDGGAARRPAAGGRGHRVGRAHRAAALRRESQRPRCDRGRGQGQAPASVGTVDGRPAPDPGPLRRRGSRRGG
jgi:UPF0271 protein